MKQIIKNLKQVYQYGKEYKSCLIINSIMCLIDICLGVLIPLISAKFIVKFTSSKFNQAILMSFVLLIMQMMGNILMLVIRKCSQVYRRGTVRNLQNKLGREILKLEQTALDGTSSGVFIHRLTNDTDKMAELFTVGIGQLTGLLANIASFIAIYFIDWRMALYYFIASNTLSLLYYIKNKAVSNKEKIYKEQFDRVTGLTSELVRGARDIKMLYSKNSFMVELDNNIDKQTKLNFDMSNTDILFNFIIFTTKYLFEFITIILLVLFINKDYFSVAIGVVLYSYKTNVLTNLITRISLLLEKCKDFNIASNRVFEILENRKYKKEKFGNKHLDKVKGNFEFKDVCFSYDNKKNVLDNLNLKIKANKTYGIVGKSGEGKTTIFNLLCKLYNHQSGLIKIDGEDINTLDEESIRGNITIINQNPYIFNLSIKDNLKLVKSDVTDEEIYEACNLACLNEFIESLPEKYDTIVGEGGVTLSGGQRQRLAIARALVQKTKIILFDEATSALDNETQNNIQSAINNLKENYTIVIIAHRLSTIINCDEIFFMKDGKIENNGTHEELLKKCKSYKQLYEYEIKSEY